MSIEETQLLTVAQVAQLLQVSKGWVHDHTNGRRRPSLKHVRLGKSVRFKRDDIQAFIEQQLRSVQ